MSDEKDQSKSYSLQILQMHIVGGKLQHAMQDLKSKNNGFTAKNWVRQGCLWLILYYKKIKVAIDV